MKNYTKQAKEVIKRSERVEENQTRLQEILDSREQAEQERAQENKQRISEMVEKTNNLIDDYQISNENAKEFDKEKNKEFDEKITKYINRYYIKQYNKNMKKLLLNEEQNSKKLSNKLIVEEAKVKDAEEQEKYYEVKTEQYRQLNEERKPVWNNVKPVTTIGFSALATFAGMAGYIVDGGVVPDALPIETAINCLGVGLAGTVAGGAFGSAILSTKINDKAHRIVQAIAERKVDKHRAKVNSILEFNNSSVDKLAEEHLSGSALERYKAKHNQSGVEGETHKPKNVVRAMECCILEQPPKNEETELVQDELERPIEKNEVEEITFEPNIDGIHGEGFMNGVVIENDTEMGE